VVRVRVREFEGGAQQRRLIGLLGGGAMAMDDAVAEADLADPNPDVGDLFHHYDGLTSGAHLPPPASPPSGAPRRHHH
jgi:hypothetical protein